MLLNKNDTRIKVLSFWSTWFVSCINELSTINDLTRTLKKEIQYDFHAISQALVVSILLQKENTKADELNFGEMYYRHAGIEICKKWHPKWISILTYQSQYYNG